MKKVLSLIVVAAAVAAMVSCAGKQAKTVEVVETETVEAAACCEEKTCCEGEACCEEKACEECACCEGETACDKAECCEAEKAE
ncbi:MAG: hypothetical protein K2O63_01250 [Alistipes sp.]|nr:hypothetical protein [Alistipes sp.]